MDCTKCGNVGRCLKLIKGGMVPYCGGSLCKPLPKEDKSDDADRTLQRK